jgi:DNA topoisomerase-1
MGKFKVIASQGHFRDICKKKMGINTSTFDCNYELIASKSKVVKRLKECILNSKRVYIASDNDREGEGIAWHIKEYFKIKDAKYDRIVFNEITEDAIVRAITNPTRINMALVNSYQSRRILDRLVGFMSTQLLWKSFESKVPLSSGRVQSATLRIIVEKEREISSFVTEPYWTIRADFGYAPVVGGPIVHLVTDTILYYNEKILKITDLDQVEQMLKGTLSDAEYSLIGTKVKIINEKAPLPFTTSTLQQVAYSKLGFSIKKTMLVAQELYEKGRITYMRTDSTTISQSIRPDIQQYIMATFGEPYVLKGDTIKSSKKQKHAQEAHEAIRPTKIVEKFSQEDVSKEQALLYALIFNRTIGHFMSTAVHHECSVEISCSKLNKKDYIFLGKQKLLHFDGWLALYGSEMSKISAKELLSKYNNIKEVIPSVMRAQCTWTTPPRRFNESTLVDKLERSGVGRPSTYASIISKLLDKYYVVKSRIEGEKKQFVHFTLMFKKKKKLTKEVEDKLVGVDDLKLVPTDVGNEINSFMENAFPDIVDIDFTSMMEGKLDDIARGELKYNVFLKEFYNEFERQHSSVLTKLKIKDTAHTTTSMTRRCLKATTDKLFMPPAVKKFIGDGKVCILRITRHGPVIEIRPEKDTIPNKSEYINLNPFFQDTGTSMETISEKDVLFLMSLPITLIVNKIKHSILYGRYGFYVRKDDESKKTYRVYKQYIPLLLTGEYKELLGKLKIR